MGRDEALKVPRPYAGSLERLKAAGLRPTRQRMSLARLLFEGPPRHVTADDLHAEAEGAHVQVSLATVYNTLHQFTKVGLLREVAVDPGRSYFDTNTSDHHHYYFESTGRLMDISIDSVDLKVVPEPPPGSRVSRVDVIVRLRDAT